MSVTVRSDKLTAIQLLLIRNLLYTVATSRKRQQEIKEGRKGVHAYASVAAFSIVLVHSRVHIHHLVWSTVNTLRTVSTQHNTFAMVMTTFKAHRSNPELVTPASPTPQGSKTLSDVDSQIPLWFYATVIEFFRPRDAVDGHETPVVDVAKAIREALAKALVYYYPIAGRLREVSKGKLAVECTGGGVVFVEAHASVRLEMSLVSRWCRHTLASRSSYATSAMPRTSLAGLSCSCK